MGVCPDALYLHLQEDLGYPNLDDPPEATFKQRASSALCRSLFKKYTNKVAGNADSVALEKFKSANLRCSSWSLQLESLKDEVLYGEFKSAMYNFFYPEGNPLIGSLEQILDQGRCGPGASMGARGKDFYTKFFDSPLTTTSDLLYFTYEGYCRQDPRWSLAEKQRSTKHGSCSVVEGSRFHFVPKSNDCSRMICIEPSLNMFYQLGLGKILEDRLMESFGISLSDQPDFNRELVRIGSIDGSFSSIDLSSASDTNGLSMLEQTMPKNALAFFKLLRSKQTSLDGETIQLSMISSMGNGYTFPLETVIFCCVVIAAMRIHGIPLKRNSRKSMTPGNFGVFGDDIVCLKEISSSVVRLLNILGYTENRDKTFVEGPFRESCGFDYFRGQNVRGVYLKRLKTQQDLFIAINSLNQWSSRTGLLLPNTISYLLSRARKTYVPLHESDDSGLKVPWCIAKSMIPFQKGHPGRIRYRRFLPRKMVLEIGETTIKVPKGAKKRDFNPEGLYLANLAGYVRDHSINIRLDVTLYDPKWGVTTSWDSEMNPSLYGDTPGRGIPPRVPRLSLAEAILYNFSMYKLPCGLAG
jgi:hypothetical protein